MQDKDIATTDSPPMALAHDPNIHLWFTAPEVGHPLAVDNHYRPSHPLVGPFLKEYHSSYDGMDDDDEVGHLHTTGQGNSRSLAREMLDSWGVNHVAIS